MPEHVQGDDRREAFEGCAIRISKPEAMSLGQPLGRAHRIGHLVVEDHDVLIPNHLTRNRRKCLYVHYVGSWHPETTRTVVAMTDPVIRFRTTPPKYWLARRRDVLLVSLVCRYDMTTIRPGASGSIPESK